MKKTFKQWMADVDSRCSEKFGLSIHDLPYINFRDAYDDGTSAATFVRNINTEDLF